MEKGIELQITELINSLESELKTVVDNRDYKRALLIIDALKELYSKLEKVSNNE